MTRLSRSSSPSSTSCITRTVERSSSPTRFGRLSPGDRMTRSENRHAARYVYCKTPVADHTQNGPGQPLSARASSSKGCN